MRIGITGHTKGIGLELSSRLESAGHDIIGFSRSTGYDISTDSDKIIERLEDCDMFINNAWHEFIQLDLFLAMIEKWCRHDKMIVNINSIAAVVPMNSVYSASKKELRSASKQWMVDPHRQCKIIDVYPGYIDTPMVYDIDVPKLSVQECVDTILWAINQPKHIEITDIGFKLHGVSR